MRIAVEDALNWLFDLEASNVRFRLDYDVEYGIDKRKGWSLTIDGSVLVQFADTFEEAVETAQSKWAAILAERDQ